MSEAQEQAAVIQWCDIRRIPVFHVPNGGSRDKREAANLKRQGGRAGAPDLVVPVARGGRPLLVPKPVPKCSLIRANLRKRA